MVSYLSQCYLSKSELKGVTGVRTRLLRGHSPAHYCPLLMLFGLGWVGLGFLAYQLA